MSIEYVKQIRVQEKEADQIRRHAVAEAKRIIEEAKVTAKDTINETRRKETELYHELIIKAETEALLEYEKIIHNAKWECDMLRKNAEENLDQAVSVITEKVTE